MCIAAERCELHELALAHCVGDRPRGLLWYASVPGIRVLMLRATTELRIAAERILGLERAAKRGGAKAPAAAVVSEQLRRVLSTLLGAAGFRALLSRAVNLAQAEVPERNLSTSLRHRHALV